MEVCSYKEYENIINKISSENIMKNKENTATTNACKLCAPLGAALAFKGIENAISILHGSQGCSTYIRRYLISHYKEPIDIASTNFNEDTAIFGGKEKLLAALKNLNIQYKPEIIGIATTCLSETIGEDVKGYVREFQRQYDDLPILANVSTPSYSGTHIEGFHETVKAIVQTLAESGNESRINIFPGLVSPADIRHLKEILDDFNLCYTLLPDYSKTLDGGLWTEYQRMPGGGTKINDIRKTGSASATIELGQSLEEFESAGKVLLNSFGVNLYSLSLPIGVAQTDDLFSLLKEVSGQEIPEKYSEERERLIDSLVDGHKYVFEAKAIIYGEEDFVTAMVSFLNEIGVIPVLCASGGNGGRLEKEIAKIIPDYNSKGITVIENADFSDMEELAAEKSPDFILGHSKGYPLAKKLNAPLIRLGFPIHDRFGGQRILHLGYRGTQQLFDKIVNTIIEARQSSNSVGYFYM
jgi:nitrogenase molybdenum-iron protein NifN